MGRGLLIFFLIFFALPLAGILAVAFAGMGVWLALLSLGLLLFGTTVGIGFADVDA